MAGQEGKGAAVSETKELIRSSVDRWNARDHDDWCALFASTSFEFEGPGGVRATGPEAVEAVWSLWNDAFPDNRIGLVGAHGEPGIATHQGLFEGTHTGPLVGPGGTVQPTGKSVSIPFVMIYQSDEEKVTGLRLYFDQLELLGQLGITG